MQVEGLHPTLRILKFTLSDVGHNTIFVIGMYDITRPLSTILDNILLVLLYSSRLKRSIVDICDVMLFGAADSEWKDFVR